MFAHFPVIPGLQNLENSATAYVSIHKQACVEDEGDFRPAEPDDEIDFWAVHGRKTDGTLEWIADFDNHLLACMFETQLARVMLIQVEGETYSLGQLETCVYLMNNTGPGH